MQLGYNWFYRPRLDYELKRYEALAFEQYLHKCLQAQVLMPPLRELRLQVNTVKRFLCEVDSEKYQSHKKITSIDLEKGNIHFSSVKDDALQEVERICHFLLKKILPFQDRFEQLKLQAKKDIEVIPVGISPMYWNEGWLLVKNNMAVDAYLYKTTKVLNDEGHEAFSMHYFSSYANTKSVNEIKGNLITQYKQMPNPATYFVNSVSTYALEETVLPLAMEKVVKLNSV